jgi:DNA-binding transcriptional ArsR family regulator
MFNLMVEYSGDVGLDLTYAALSHPVRRDLLHRLRAGPATVTRLAEPFDLSLAAVSKHLRVLEEASLVRRRVTGREHHLSLEPVPLGEASIWLETYRDFWEQRMDALEQMLRKRRSDDRRRR